MRVKGWTIKDGIYSTVADLPYSGRTHIYVHQTSPDAVEIVTICGSMTNPLEGFIDNIPVEFINKRVRVIIEEVEG